MLFRSYQKSNGHRQQLTQIEITKIALIKETKAVKDTKETKAVKEAKPTKEPLAAKKPKVAEKPKVATVKEETKETK